MDKPSLRVLLVRHGETEWSLSGRHTGRTDLPLTANGERIARALQPALAGTAFSHVLASPRLRARRTCELAGLGGAATASDDLAEWDYGDYEGLRSSEIQQARPGWDIWRDGCPGGESPGQVTARADRVIDRLRTLPGAVAIFSHGHFGRVLATRWIGLPVNEGRHFVLDPATLGVLGFDPAHPDCPAILSWNAAP